PVRYPTYRDLLEVAGTARGKTLERTLAAGDNHPHATWICAQPNGGNGKWKRYGSGAECDWLTLLCAAARIAICAFRRRGKPRPRIPLPPRLPKGGFRRVAAQRFAMKNTSTLMFALLLLSIPSLGADYHVSPRGADSNPGTIKRPFRTIQRAADLVHP